MSDIRVRYAPSPTGFLHIGGLRTALYDWLFAKHSGGTFILRIEDTDRNRLVPGALEDIMESMRWIGIDWDEGPGIGGPYGPYIQSERTALYRQMVDDLIAKGGAYRCFCTPQRLETVRNEREKAKISGGYDRHCRELPSEESARLLEAGTRHIVRFKVPAGRTIAFTDEIRGLIEYQSDLLEDLVLMKSDGFPTYHLAAVTDDHHMKISHVLRGEEWIASTPTHLLMYEAFGWEPPRFAHLPLILDPSGGKLSKRKGNASVGDFRKAGYLPEAVFNFLALVGWAPGDDREKMTREEIVKAFGLDRVSPKAAVFDEKKLEWMNGLYLQERSIFSLAAEVTPLLNQAGIATDRGQDDQYLLNVISLLKSRCKRLNDFVGMAGYFFSDPTGYEEKAAKKYFIVENKETLSRLIDKISTTQDFNHSTLEALYHSFAEGSSLGAAQTIHPTRLAISGTSVGPGLFEMMELLGKERVLRRMRSAFEYMAKL